MNDIESLMKYSVSDLQVIQDCASKFAERCYLQANKASKDVADLYKKEAAQFDELMARASIALTVKIRSLVREIKND